MSNQLLLQINLILSSRWFPLTLSIFVAIVSYLLIKDRVSYKTKHRLLEYSFLITLLIFVGGLFIPNTNLQQASFTFASVYLGFWLNEQRKKLDDRRKLKFSLGLVWQELRYNRHQLEVIKANYGFYLDKPDFLQKNLVKFSHVNSLTELLKTNVYETFIANEAIVNLTKDDLFNTLEIAYNDIKYLQSALRPILLDYNTKVSILQSFGDGPYTGQILDDLKDKIKMAGQELAIAYRTTVIAIDKIDKQLNSMGVKVDEISERADVLVKEDKKFIENVIRETPKESPKQLFKNQ